jgi:cytochrome P450
MALIHIITLLIAALVLNWPYQLYCNYLIARKTGLPLIISPITPFTLPWHIFPTLFPFFIKRQRWYRALDQTCAWQDKNRLHAELGTCFMHVSPGMNMLCTSDPVAIDNVFKKMNDFVKPEVFKTLDFFGPNIITVNHEPWVRHRRLTAPCFNERISTFVWDESLRQANDMLEDWLAKPDAKSNTVVQILAR